MITINKKFVVEDGQTKAGSVGGGFSMFFS